MSDSMESSTSRSLSLTMSEEDDHIALLELRDCKSNDDNLVLFHTFRLDALQKKMSKYGELPASRVELAVASINTVMIEALNGAINFGGADSCAMVAMTTLFGLSTTEITTSGQQFLLAISGFIAGLFMGKGHTSRATSFSEKAKIQLSSLEFVNNTHAPLHDFLTNSVTLFFSFQLALIGMKHIQLPPIVDPTLTSFVGMFLSSIVTIFSKMLLPQIYTLRYRQSHSAMSHGERNARTTIELHGLVSDTGRIATKEANIVSWGKGYAAGISNFAMQYLSPIIAKTLKKSGHWSTGNIRALNGFIGITIFACGWFFATDALIPLLRWGTRQRNVDKIPDDTFV